MEFKMNKNKAIGNLTFIIIIALIAIPTFTKVSKKHQERLMKVTENQIIDTSKNCYYSESCINDKITLAELYEKTGLAPIINPITKMEFNEASYVNVINDFEFIEK